MADGIPATLLSLETEQLPSRRLAFYYKLVSPAQAGGVIVVTGWVTCASGGGGFLKNAGMLDFLKGHVTSLVLDEEKLDLPALERLYASHNWDIPRAMSTTRLANQQVQNKDYAKAVATYAKALEVCDELSAARTGMAWVLLTSSDAAVLNVPEGLRQAEIAVRQTDRRDPASLGTLAEGLSKSGEIKAAIDTVTEAIRLRPADRSLRRKLQQLQELN